MRGSGFVAALVVVATTVPLAACADPSPAPAAPASAPSSSTSVAAPSSTVSAEPSRDLGPVGPTASAAQGYVPSLVRSTGSDGVVIYDVQVPTISGGDAAVVERFTESMRASLAGRVRTLSPAPHPISVTDGSLANGERSRVTRIGARTVAGLLLTNYFMQGGAHPNNQIGTVVLDTRTAQPILLSQVLPSDGAVARVKALVRQHVGDGPTPFVDDEAALANWLPTDTGITFYVPTIHAAGDYWPAALTWAELNGIVPDAVVALLRA